MFRSIGNTDSGTQQAAVKLCRWPMGLALAVACAFSHKSVSAQPPVLQAPGGQAFMAPPAPPAPVAAPLAGLPMPTAPAPIPTGMGAPTIPTGVGVPTIPTANARLVQNGLSLEKPLPRQIQSMPMATEELEVIDKRSQLIVTNKRVMRFAIADPTVIDIVQYSPTELSVVGLDIGSTNLLYWFEGEVDPLIYEVTVVPDPALEEQRRIDYGRLERKLAILFPNSKVYLIPLSGKIIVKGQARDGEEAARILQIVRGEVINQDGRLGGPQPGATQDQLDAGLGLGDVFDLASSRIVNMLEVPGEYQVMLRVRIAELSRSQLRRMGLDLAGLLNDGRHIITSTLGGAGGALTGIFENGELTVLLDWLESNGTAKILSEPTLTVLSGHTASFLSGAEFAVPTIVGVGGAQGQTTTFRGFGTSIIVTPNVIDRDLIRMRIVPEFSQANQGLAVGGIPGLNSRRVQTTVELREGQTIAIAGLISHQSNVEITRIPFLGEIPIIGPKLFNTKQATQDESELLVLVTPELVRPMDADEVPPVPGYEVTHPNQWELYHAAMTEGAPDTSYYQVPPLGSDSNFGINVPYRLFNPVPASPQYAPVPTNTYGTVPQGQPSPATAPTAPPAGSYGQPYEMPQPQHQVVPTGYQQPQLPQRNWNAQPQGRWQR